MTRLNYFDFHLEIGLRSGSGYPVAVLNSPAGQGREIMQSLADDSTLAEYLQGLQNLHLDPESLQRLGTVLFESVFSGSIRSRFDASRLEAWKAEKGLRLRLSVLAPELAVLPWEYLYDPDRGEYLALSDWTPLVRFIEFPQPVAPLKVAPPLQVLGVVSSPHDLPPLDVQEEMQRLETAIQTLRDRRLLKLTWLEGQTWRDLQRALRGGPWHVLHFIGHAGFDPSADEGFVLVADDLGKMAPLWSSELGRLLANHRSLRLVVLNACETASGSERDAFSGTASTIVRRGVPAVIGMQTPLSDLAAAELTRSFYEALADGYPVDAALSEARIAMSLTQRDSWEWGAPVLYLHAPDGIIFVGNSEETQSDQRQAPTEPQIPDRASTQTTPPRPTPLTSVQRAHLETQHDELQKRYQTLTRRIEALDTDIGREMDSERKLTLKERRAEALAERDQIAADIARIEQQLAESGATPPLHTDESRAQTAPATIASLSPQERTSLEHQLTELRENLRLIEERKAEYVQETDIPLQLIKDERRVRECIADLAARLHQEDERT